MSRDRDPSPPQSLQHGAGVQAALLEVESLSIAFGPRSARVRVVDEVSFSLARGETLGIVGESGSGKSVTCLSILGLLEGAEVSGSIRFEGEDLLSLSPAALRNLRGARIGMVFQDPLSSLNPFHRVGRQIAEAVQIHQQVGRGAARRRAVELLGHVGIPRPDRQFEAYPHEFSGGMRQRVMIAMALANDPALLIGDEPTTALDVSVQAQILELIERLKGELGIAVILVTHNLGIVAEVADRVLVMYAGRVVESAGTEDVFAGPEHPYTWGLLASIPELAGDDVEARGARLASIPGLPPDPRSFPPGCRFHPRCAFAFERCQAEQPVLAPVGPDHVAACHLPSGVLDAARAAAGAAASQLR